LAAHKTTNPKIETQLREEYMEKEILVKPGGKKNQRKINDKTFGSSAD